MQDGSSEDSAARLSALLETAVDGIVMMDASGIVQVYNSACEKLFGYEAREVIGQNVKMLMPSPYREEHDAYLSRYKETGAKKIIGIGREVVGQRKDGSTFPMYLSVGEGRTAEQPIFVGIIHNISEQRQIELALREREARLSSILDTVPDAVIIIDDSGNIESFSPAATRLFGYPFGEVFGKNVSMLMPSPYKEEHDSYIKRYLRTGEKRIIGIGRIVVGKRRDESTFPMELSVGEILLGSRRLFTGFIHDITERQGAENRLRDIQAELLHISRLSAMGQMASALAHELNQPLSAIMNYAKAARRHLDNPQHEPGRVQELLDKTAAQTARAGEIIRRLRDFIEKGRSHHTIEQPHKIIEDALALALVGTAAENIKIILELEPDLPAVLMDRIQIQQVLINLVRNSIEAMREVDDRKLTLSVSMDAGRIAIKVTDTGPGLTPEIADKLFQPFITTKETGMGIGLSICRTIVEAHGGSLRAEPNLPRGVSFIFTLPVLEHRQDIP